MAKTIGRYCKAYYLSNFREYKHWKEKAENARVEKTEVDGKLMAVPRKLTDKEFLYLHENYCVTDGIYLDENIIFDDVTDEWKEFCVNNLKFEVPKFDSVEIKDEKKQSTSGTKDK